MDATTFGLDANRRSTVDLPLPAAIAGAIHNRPREKSRQPFEPIVGRLVKEGAQGITQWITLPNGRVAGRVFRSQESDEIQKQEQLVAAEVLKNEKVEIRVLSLSQPTIFIGVPCLGLSGVAMTVHFQIGATDNRTEFIRQRQTEVELAAAQLGVLWLKESIGNHESKTTSASSPSENSISPPATNSKNSWGEIRQALNKLLAESLRQRQASWKTYMAGLAGLIVFLLLPWPHVVKCQVQCEPSTRRFIVAPFESTLLKTHVEVGQLVEADQVLAELDGSNLRSQIASLQAKLSQANQRRDAALANRDASKSEFERLETKHLQEEIDLLQNRERSLQVRSPISGIVVSGDLRKAVGATLTVGQTLFEIGPLNELVAEIAVPEDEIAYVKLALNTRVSLNAIPGQWHASKIERIHPRNEIRDFNSVFIAEANILNGDETVRPGMTGVARIQAGWQTLGWIIFHKPWNALRQTIGW